ncbi:MAG: translocation/assembly module TamB domain-containing protein, partial [Pseudomonadota bacterium]
MTPRRHVPALVGKVARAFAVVVLVIVVVLGLALLGANFGPVRARIAERATDALSTTFRGRIVVRALSRIDAFGVRGADVQVFDPEGRLVVDAVDADVRLFWPRLLWDVVAKTDRPLLVSIDRVAVERIGIRLIDDGKGAPSLARTFEPRTPAPKGEESSTTVVVDAIALRSVRVRGALAGYGNVDVDLGETKAALTVAPRRIEARLEHLVLVARGVPTVGEVQGTISGELVMPKVGSAGRRARATVDARVAGSAVLVTARLDGDEVDAVVRSPEIVPATLQRLVPALAPEGPLTLLVRVRGTLPKLAGEIELTRGRARVAARGTVFVSERPRARWVVEGRSIDLAALLRDGVRTDIGFSLVLTLDSDAEGIRAEYRLTSSDSTVAARTMPPLVVEGRARVPEGKRARPSAEGSIEVGDPRASVRIEYDVEAVERGVVARATGHGNLDRPEALAALGARARGSFSVSGRFESATGTLEATLSGDLAEVAHPTVAARDLDFSVSLQGKREHLRFEARASAESVSVPGRELTDVRVSAVGAPERFDVVVRASGTDPESIVARATVAPGDTLVVRSPELWVRDRDGALTARADQVAVNGKHIVVDRFTLAGPGQVELSVVWTGRLEALDLHAAELDVARLLAIFGIRTELRSGEVSATAHFSGKGRRARGALQADVRAVTIGDVEGGSARADLEVVAGKLGGSLDLAVQPGATSHIELEGVDVRELSLTPTDLERFTGSVSLSGELRLDELGPVLARAGIGRAEGVVRYEVTARRSESAPSAPALRARLRTQSLVLAGARPDIEQTPTRETARAAEPWSVQGVDLALEASSENGTARVDAELFDATGTLLVADAEWTGVRVPRSIAAARRELGRAPFEARVRVPERRFDGLPPAIRPASLDGALTAEVQASGTLQRPRVHVRGTMTDFGPVSERRYRPRIQLELEGEYERAGGVLRARGTRRSERVFEIDSRWTGDLVALARVSASAPSPVRGAVDVRLRDFPIGVIPALFHRQIQGNVSGTARLEGFGENAALEIELTGARIGIERTRVRRVEARVRALGDALDVEGRIEAERGSARVELGAPLSWGARVAPEVGTAVQGAFVADDLRLNVLAPLVSGSIGDLDGRLDAAIRVDADGGGTPRLSGRATIAEGAVQVPAIGQQFRGIDLEATITPERVRVPRFRARGTTGALEASAEAELEGLVPVRAKAEVAIGERTPIPLTWEGQSLGDAWGNLDVTYTRDEADKVHRIAVNVPRFEIDMPRLAPHDIQPLEDAEHVRVGYYQSDGRFVRLPLQPLEEERERAPSEYTTLIVVSLGRVAVEAGDLAAVELGGKLQARIRERLDVLGKIESRRGQLDLQGKRFDIDRAVVTFTGGAPDDPSVSLVARWQAPAGYVVTAEYTGTARKGKLALSSEPNLSENEILTLLLFGSPEGTFGATGSGSTAAAVGLAGGTAARGLNRALARLSDLDVQARIDTSTGAARPELVIQLTPRIAARVTQA